MIKTEQKLGLSGEFQVIVRRADGSIKYATDMQPNLVLDNGIKHYIYLEMINSAGAQQKSFRGGFLSNCLVGSGNKAPSASDVALQNFIAKSTSSRETKVGVEQPSDGLHEGFVKMWTRRKFIFDSIDNKNITEVGLATWYGNETIDKVKYDNVYTLVTRALIKDSSGTPISVTVLQGEILEVVYQINMYIDVRRQTGSFKLTTTIDGKDKVDTFDYFLQPYNIGQGGSSSSNSIDNPIYFDCEDIGVESWGVKETDDELTADYNLNDDAYNSITHLDTTGLINKVTTNKTSTCEYSNKYSNNYLSSTVIERSFETRSITYENVNGIYTHNHKNGIRAYAVGAAIVYSSYSLVECLIVVKNRANGQGIKKNNRQLWAFNHTITVGRWEG